MLRHAAKILRTLSISPRARAPSSRQNMAYPNNPSSAEDLLSALPAKFEQARQSGQLYFFPSQARDVFSEGRRVRLLIILFYILA